MTLISFIAVKSSMETLQHTFAFRLTVSVLLVAIHYLSYGFALVAGIFGSIALGGFLILCVVLVSVFTYEDNKDCGLPKCDETKNGFLTTLKQEETTVCSSQSTYGSELPSTDKIAISPQASPLPRRTEDTIYEVQNGRTDLTQTRIFTLDPPGAVVLDDAVSCKLKEDNPLEVEIGVHVSDVTHYVRQQQPLDWEAIQMKKLSMKEMFRRCFPDKMKHQTNKISLRPGEERLTLSVVFTFNLLTGEIVPGPMKIFQSVIRSCCQLDFKTAQHIIDSNKEGEHSRNTFVNAKSSKIAVFGNHTLSDVASDVCLLHKVITTIRQKQNQHGLYEHLRWYYNEELQQKQESSQMVEELMILVNHFVANKLVEAYPTTALLRVQPKPDAKRLQWFAEFCKQKYGVTIDVSSAGSIGSSLQRAKEQFGNEQTQMLVERLVARILPMPTTTCSGFYRQDKKNWLHYGLGLSPYTWFTSPLRRSADLIVHRLLIAMVNQKKDISNIVLEPRESDDELMDERPSSPPKRQLRSGEDSDLDMASPPNSPEKHKKGKKFRLSKVEEEEEWKLVDLLAQLNSTDEKEKSHAAEGISDCLWGNQLNRKKLIEGGGVEQLITVLQSGSLEAKANAADALRNIALNYRAKEIIRNKGGLKLLVDLLFLKPQRKKKKFIEVDNLVDEDVNGYRTCERAKENAADAIWMMVEKSFEDKVAVRKLGAIEGLLNLLREGSERGKRKAAGALFSVAIDNESKVEIREFGGIPLLIELIRTANDHASIWGAASLGLLAVDNRKNRDVIREEGGIPVLLNLLERDSLKAKFYALGALRNLCWKNEKNVKQVTQLDGIHRLRYILENNTTARVRRLALSTLKNILLTNPQLSNEIDLSEYSFAELNQPGSPPCDYKYGHRVSPQNRQLR